MKTKKEIFILDEDLLCLKWLWRWKLLTTRALAVGVYKSKKLEMAYRRMLKLEKAKYIQPYWSRDGKRCLWMLNDKGYQLLNQNFPNQFRAGYKTENPNHDYWVSAIHLDNWLAGRPMGTDFMSEQEIRRLEVEDYPSWVPKSKAHRSDGYWKINENPERRNSVVSLEIELSKKEPESYKSIAEFYKRFYLFHQVLWVVKSEGDVNYIKKHLESGLCDQERIHNFTTINHFIESGWQAKIIAGPCKDKMISDLIIQQGVNDPAAMMSDCLMDLRKYPIVSMVPPKITGYDLGLNRHIYKSKDSWSEPFREPDTTYEVY